MILAILAILVKLAMARELYDSGYVADVTKSCDLQAGDGSAPQSLIGVAG